MSRWRPGPTQTALVFSDRPLVGTFHRAGESAWYRALRRLGRWGANHLARPGRGVRRGQGRGEPDLRRHLRAGVERDRRGPLPGRRAVADRRVRPSCSSAATSPARDWRCSSRPSPVFPPTCGSGSRRRGRRPPGCARPPATTTGSSGSASSAKREKIRRIRGADVLCAPSLHGESFGVVLLEGMAAGTPVVASDLAGYRNVARPDVDALLTAPGDPGGPGGRPPGGPGRRAAKWTPWWPAPSSGPPASRSRAWPSGTSICTATPSGPADPRPAGRLREATGRLASGRPVRRRPTGRSGVAGRSDCHRPGTPGPSMGRSWKGRRDTRDQSHSGHRAVRGGARPGPRRCRPAGRRTHRRRRGAGGRRRRPGGVGPLRRRAPGAGVHRRARRRPGRGRPAVQPG